MPKANGSIAGTIATLLTRVLVPLWVLAGATFKLYELTPKNLPSVILKPAIKAEIDLDLLLRTLVGLEFFSVLVMLLIPRLSKAMAIYMLSCFCLILLGEMYYQATSCGCFGSVKMKPWQMLAIDGSLLVAVIVFSAIGRRTTAAPATGAPASTPANYNEYLKQNRSGRSWKGPILALVPLVVLGLGIAFAVPAKADKPQTALIEPGTGPTSIQPPATQSATSATRPAQPQGAAPGGQANPATPTATASAATQPDPTINPAPSPVPNSWYVKGSTDEWVGKKWRDLELFKLMQRWPKDLDHGKHYVVFYSRTCEHCEHMFTDDLPVLQVNHLVTAIQIPNSKSEMTASDAWEMPPGLTIELLQLPLGCNYIITPPLALRIENGAVTCATEGEHKKCFQME